VTIRIRPSAPATLTAAGKRHRVPAKRTKVTIRLPKKPKIGVLRIPFRLSRARRRGGDGAREVHRAPQLIREALMGFEPTTFCMLRQIGAR
jgi:hypothetical protein